eukprot:jgi/Psemu1/4895/gm1.4895_g
MPLELLVCLYLLQDNGDDGDDDDDASPFLYLFNSGNEQSLLNCCGAGHKVFGELLGLFEPIFNSYMINRDTNAIRKWKVNVNGVWSGRKHESNATCCLGLVVLHWFQTQRSVTRSVSMVFGLTSTVVYKWVKFSRKVLLFVLQKHPKAMVRPPTEEEVEEYIAAIGLLPVVRVGNANDSETVPLIERQTTVGDIWRWEDHHELGDSSAQLPNKYHWPQPDPECFDTSNGWILLLCQGAKKEDATGMFE